MMSEDRPPSAPVRGLARRPALAWLLALLLGLSGSCGTRDDPDKPPVTSPGEPQADPPPGEAKAGPPRDEAKAATPSDPRHAALPTPLPRLQRALEALRERGVQTEGGVVEQGGEVRFTHESSAASAHDDQLLLVWATAFGALGRIARDKVTIVNTVGGQAVAEVSASSADILAMLDGKLSQDAFLRRLEVRSVQRHPEALGDPTPQNAPLEESAKTGQAGADKAGGAGEAGGAAAADPGAGAPTGRPPLPTLAPIAVLNAADKPQGKARSKPIAPSPSKAGGAATAAGQRKASVGSGAPSRRVPSARRSPSPRGSRAAQPPTPRPRGSRQTR